MDYAFDIQRRNNMVDYLMLFIGVPYIFGGNNPMTGLDCSGLVCEGLRAEGIIKYNEDLTSRGIYRRLMTERTMSPDIHRLVKGDFLFFGKDVNNINHVAVAVDSYRMIEAGGGDSTTKTVDDAKIRNAMVRIRPIKMRSDLVASVRL